MTSFVPAGRRYHEEPLMGQVAQVAPFVTWDHAHSQIRFRVFHRGSWQTYWLDFNRTRFISLNSQASGSPPDYLVDFARRQMRIRC